jgi:hypothetical protein
MRSFITCNHPQIPLGRSFAEIYISSVQFKKKKLQLRALPFWGIQIMRIQFQMPIMYVS